MKKSYTEILIEINSRLSALDTHIPHINNHLFNIDQHLNKLNERTNTNEKNIALNKASLSRLYKIGGGLLGTAILITGIVFGILQVV